MFEKKINELKKIYSVNCDDENVLYIFAKFIRHIFDNKYYLKKNLNSLDMLNGSINMLLLTPFIVNNSYFDSSTFFIDLFKGSESKFEKKEGVFVYFIDLLINNLDKELDQNPKKKEKKIYLACESAELNIKICYLQMFCKVSPFDIYFYEGDNYDKMFFPEDLIFVNKFINNLKTYRRPHKDSDGLLSEEVIDEILSNAEIKLQYEVGGKVIKETLENGLIVPKLDEKIEQNTTSIMGVLKSFIYGLFWKTSSENEKQLLSDINISEIINNSEKEFQRSDSDFNELKEQDIFVSNSEEKTLCNNVVPTQYRKNVMKINVINELY